MTSIFLSLEFLPLTVTAGPGEGITLVGRDGDGADVGLSTTTGNEVVGASDGAAVGSNPGLWVGAGIIVALGPSDGSWEGVGKTVRVGAGTLSCSRRLVAAVRLKRRLLVVSVRVVATGSLLP